MDDILEKNQRQKLINFLEKWIKNKINNVLKSLLDLKDLREKNFIFWQQVLKEDVDAIEGMQEGRKSPAYNGGNFSPIMDSPTHMFHKWVAKNLTI